jgi:TonB family protein
MDSHTLGACSTIGPAGLNLRRLEGVSARPLRAGAFCRNPERSLRRISYSRNTVRYNRYNRQGAIVMSRISMVLFLLLSASSFAADPELYLKSAPMPFYPGLARAARIEGKVSLRLTVDEQGDTSEVEATSGHIMLRQAAIDNVKGWKFGWPQPCMCRVHREVVFLYKLSGKQETSESPTATVKWFGKTRVEVQADVPPINTQVSR